MTMKHEKKKVLTGNSFPLNLIRRPVRITPVSLEEYCSVLAETDWKSYWGHANTLEAVRQICGYDLTPDMERPALTLDASGYPQLENESYRECYVLSPEYRAGFRPALGKEVGVEEILSWQILKIIWE